MVASTAKSRATGSYPTGAESRAGTGVHAEINGIHPTLTIPRTDSYSEKTRHRVKEVSWYNSRGGVSLGGGGGSEVKKNKDICRIQYSKRLGNQSCYALLMRLGYNTGNTIFWGQLLYS